MAVLGQGDDREPAGSRRAGGQIVQSHEGSPQSCRRGLRLRHVVGADAALDGLPFDVSQICVAAQRVRALHHLGVAACLDVMHEDPDLEAGLGDGHVVEVGLALRAGRLDGEDDGDGACASGEGRRADDGGGPVLAAPEVEADVGRLAHAAGAVRAADDGGDGELIEDDAVDAELELPASGRRDARGNRGAECRAHLKI